MAIPQMDLKAQTELLGPEIVEALRQVVYSGAFVNGAPIDQLEKALAELSGSKFAIACSSGTDALLAALMALDIGPGDEVITTPFSFFATLGVTLRVGAIPVLADIEPDSFNICPKKIAEAITPKTKAIIPVHLYGQCADMDPILKIAKEHGIKIIEDNAQAMGATYLGGRKAGSMGDIGCTSFYPSKNLGAMGDAGMIFTSSEALAIRLKKLRNHGQSERYLHPEVGGNFRMDCFQAAVLNVKTKYFLDWITARQAIADRYDEQFKASGLSSKIVTPKRPLRGKTGDTLDHVFHQYVIRASNRNELKAYLDTKKISSMVYYPIPFHKQPCWISKFGTDFHLRESEKAAEQVLALPMYPELSESDQKQVIEAIASFY